MNTPRTDSTERTREVAREMLAALQVIVLTPATAAWLEANDPKALEQVRRAIAAGAEIPYPTAADTPASVVRTGP